MEASFWYPRGRRTATGEDPGQSAGRLGLFVVEACVLPVYVVIAVPASLPGLAAVIAVCRANRSDLPAIIRAWRMGPRDGDGEGGPPSLPKP